jgi:hypothetical protein
MEDHLAWYDLHSQLFPARGAAALPLVGWLIRLQGRSQYKHAMTLPASRNAFDERSFELSNRGVWESNPRFDFFVPWSEISVAAATDTHVFLARSCMNAFVIPLSACSHADERNALLQFIEKHIKLQHVSRNV